MISHQKRRRRLHNLLVKIKKTHLKRHSDGISWKVPFHHMELERKYVQI